MWQTLFQVWDTKALFLCGVYLRVILGKNNLRKNAGYYGKYTKHLWHDEVLNSIWLSLSRSLH